MGDNPRCIPGKNEVIEDQFSQLSHHSQKMLIILHELASGTTNIQELVHSISLHEKRNELFNLLETICDDAKELLIKGIATAFENGNDAEKVKSRVSGQERIIALLACEKDAEGQDAMYIAIRSIIEYRLGTLV